MDTKGERKNFLSGLIYHQNRKGQTHKKRKLYTEMKTVFTLGYMSC